jgi:hypothetical protein
MNEDTLSERTGGSLLDHERMRTHVASSHDLIRTLLLFARTSCFFYRVHVGSELYIRRVVSLWLIAATKLLRWSDER